MTWDMVTAVAVATVGLIEWIKGFDRVNIPKTAYRLSMPVVAVCLALLFSVTPGWVTTGILSVAVSQVGYQGVVEPIKKMLERRMAD